MATKGPKYPEYIKPRGDGGVDITLSRPLNVSGAQVNVLTMREPTVEDQLNAESSSTSDADKEMTFMCHLCMIAPDDLKKMALRDYKRMQEAFLGFLI
ncbi:tape measure chaperone [Achromobacter phage Mano]|uniref:Tape measure chaperone n=1 Tax=Achromobacter phage Mano TaxID=2767570 RepID=A0A7L8G699_9CAUD|nr:tail protein [Achromobacter phage Mano]QOE32753.1 tape measure chaperone [Achromobacter phage Mano]